VASRPGKPLTLVANSASWLRLSRSSATGRKSRHRQETLCPGTIVIVGALRSLDWGKQISIGLREIASSLIVSSLVGLRSQSTWGPSAALFVKFVSISCSGASESRRRQQSNENARLCQKSLNGSKLSFTCPSPAIGSRRSILARRRNLPPDGVGCFVGFGNNVAELNFRPATKVRNSDRILQPINRRSRFRISHSTVV
jgi:hypothetical protein